MRQKDLERKVSVLIMKKQFKWKIIYECDEVMLDMMETFKIIVNHSHYLDGKGYNMTWGGGSISGYKHTEETKKKMSISKVGDKNPMKNPIIREKMSNTLKGRTKETHEYIRISNEKKSSYNIQNSEWLSISRKKFKNTIDCMSVEERKNKFGHIHTDEEKKRMSEKRKGKTAQNDDRVRKMSETKRIYFQKMDLTQRKNIMSKTKGMNWYHNDDKKMSKLFLPQYAPNDWIKGRKKYEN